MLLHLYAIYCVFFLPSGYDDEVPAKNSELSCQFYPFLNTGSSTGGYESIESDIPIK